MGACDISKGCRRDIVTSRETHGYGCHLECAAVDVNTGIRQNAIRLIGGGLIDDESGTTDDHGLIYGVRKA